MVLLLWNDAVSNSASRGAIKPESRVGIMSCDVTLSMSWDVIPCTEDRKDARLSLSAPCPSSLSVS